MSTHTHRHQTRLGTGLLALSALVAIGVAAAFLALTGVNRTITPKPSTVGAEPSSRATPAVVTSQAPTGYFRDPTTHALLRITTGDGGDGPRARHPHWPAP